MNPRYAMVAIRARHRCEYCGAPEAVFNFAFEVEHIVPTSHAGPDVTENWGLACRSCNVHKANRLDGIDPQSLKLVRLFHPREDSWNQHFRVSTETGSIEGVTPIGRVTVEHLALNSNLQLEARKKWIRLGLYP